MDSNFKERLKVVRTFVFDVDGVLTDGHLLVMPDGEFLRTMHIRDGYAMQLAVKKGYRLAIISGGHSAGVPLRLQRLGIEEVHMGVPDKTSVFRDLVSRYRLDPATVLYMGDDLPDLEVMALAGVPCCPNDAAPEIRSVSIYVSAFGGGTGCVRDVIEQTMRLHGTWE